MCVCVHERERGRERTPVWVATSFRLAATSAQRLDSSRERRRTFSLAPLQTRRLAKRVKARQGETSRQRKRQTPTSPLLLLLSLSPAVAQFTQNNHDMSLSSLDFHSVGSTCFRERFHSWRKRALLLHLILILSAPPWFARCTGPFKSTSLQEKEDARIFSHQAGSHETKNAKRANDNEVHDDDDSLMGNRGRGRGGPRGRDSAS